MNKINNILYMLLLVLFSGELMAAENSPLTSPEYCGSCHQRIFQEWKTSRMAKDINNRKVYQFYTGEHGTGGFDGLGFKPMKKGETGDCADCHFPLLSLKAHKEGKEVDLGVAMNEKKDHGISCIFCHSVASVHIKQDANGRYHTRISDTVTLGRSDTHYGPLKDSKSPVHKSQYSALHKTSELCGSCHLNQEKFLSISTYKDWKEAFDSGKTDKTCQQCHMPLIEGEVASAIGGPKRKGLRRHTFVGSYDPAMLKKALSLNVDSKISANKLIIKVLNKAGLSCISTKRTIFIVPFPHSLRRRSKTSKLGSPKNLSAPCCSRATIFLTIVLKLVSAICPYSSSSSSFPHFMRN